MVIFFFFSFNFEYSLGNWYRYILARLLELSDISYIEYAGIRADTDNVYSWNNWKSLIVKIFKYLAR